MTRVSQTLWATIQQPGKQGSKPVLFYSTGEIVSFHVSSSQTMSFVFLIHFHGYFLKVF